MNMQNTLGEIRFDTNNIPKQNQGKEFSHLTVHFLSSIHRHTPYSSSSTACTYGNSTLGAHTFHAPLMRDFASGFCMICTCVLTILIPCTKFI